MDPSTNRYVAALDKRLMELFTAACAPLSSDSLVNDLADLNPDDFTVSVALDEIKFLKSLADSGLTALCQALEGLPSEIAKDEQVVKESPQVSVALLAAASFATRLAFVSTQLHQICSSAVEQLNADPTSLMKELESRAKKGERPTGETGERLKQCLNFTPNSRWGALEVPLKNRVGFKKTAAVIFENKVEEEKVKVTEVRRKKQRNPTGFHKFNFKDLMLEGGSDGEGVDGRSRSRSTDEGSASVSGTTAGGGNSTSRSASSGAEEIGDMPDDEMPGGAAAISYQDRRSASVVLFPCQKEREVIQDEAADPDWEEQQRHKKRFSRIRNRVPTGHPSVMKGPSDELAGIVHEYERTLSSLKLDSATAVNTEANKYIKIAEADQAKAAARSPVGQKKNVTLVDETE